MSDWFAPKSGAAGQVKLFLEVASPRVGYYLTTAVADGSGAGTLNLKAADAPDASHGWPTANALPDTGDIVQVDDEDFLVDSETEVDVVVQVEYTHRGYYGTDTAAHAVDAGVRLFRDFTDRLLSLPRIKHVAEKSLNTVTSSVSTVTLDNRDRQWNDPTWLGSWDGRLARFYWVTPTEDRAGLGVASSAYYGTALGTFSIDEVQCRGDVAILKLVSMEMPLKEARSAEDVKDKGWYLGRNAKFLLSQLLGHHYSAPKHSPPNFWLTEMSSNLELEATSGRPVISIYGRPPDWDGTDWLQEPDEIARATCLNYPGSGTRPTRLYYGVGGTLWYRDLTTMTDTKIGIIGADDTHSIVRLWASVKEPGTMWGVTLKAHLQATISLPDLLVPDQTMTPFKVDSSGTVTTYATQQISSGYWSYMPLKIRTWGDGFPSRIASFYDETLSIPFPQWIRAPVGGVWDTDAIVYQWDGSYGVGFIWPPILGYWIEGSHVDGLHITEIFSQIFGAYGGGSPDWFIDNWGMGGQPGDGYPDVGDPTISVNGAEVPAGYINLATHNVYWFPGDTVTSGAIYSMGQRGAIDYAPNEGTEGAIFFTAPYDAGGYTAFYLKKLTCSSGTVTSYNIGVGIPTALCCSKLGTNRDVYIGRFQPVQNNDNVNDKSETYLNRYSMGGVFQNTLFTSPDADANHEYYVFLELAPTPNDDGVLFTALNRGPTALWDSTTRYRQGWMLRGHTSSTPTTVNGPYGSAATSAQICGLTSIRHLAGENTGYEIFALSGDGRVVRLDSQRHWALVPQSELPPGESSSTGALTAWAPATNPGENFMVYGISAPLPSFYSVDAGPDEPSFATGKYYLWKLDRTIADRYELADFSGWSSWKAIQKIAATVQHTAYFDTRGRFRIDPIPKPNDPSIDYSFDVAGNIASSDYHEWVREPSLHYGKNVYNSVTVTPYVAEMNTRATVTLRPSGASDLNSSENVPTIDVGVTGLYPIRVILRCVTGGRLLHTTAAGRPSFSKIVDTSKIGAALTKATVEGSGDLYVDQIPLNEDGSLQFALGDALTIGDREYWSGAVDVVSYRIVSGYDSTNLSYLIVDPVINPTNDPDSPYPAGTPIWIISSDSSPDPTGTLYTFADGVAQDIGEGLTVTITAGVFSVDDEPWFAPGDSIIIDIPGMKLRRADRSIQTVVSTVSLAAGYPKREPPATLLGKNRLLGRALGLELAHSIVRRYRYPHYELKGGTWRLIPWLKPLDHISLRDPEIFPTSSGETERFYVQSIEQDLSKLTTTVDLKGVRDIT